MTSVYSPEGKRIGVTALLAKPVKVSSLKTVTKMVIRRRGRLRRQRP